MAGYPWQLKDFYQVLRKRDMALASMKTQGVTSGDDLDGFSLPLIEGAYQSEPCPSFSRKRPLKC